MVLDEHDRLNCLEMRKHTWYKGNIYQNDAEYLLLATTSDGKYVQPDGAFLVRDNGYPRDLTLEVKFYDTVQHMRIYFDGSGAFFIWVVKFISVHELTTYHRIASASRRNDMKIYLKDMVEMDPEPPNVGEKRYVALYDFEPQECDELLLKKGDEIPFFYGNDSNWWKGIRCQTYQVGYFPRVLVDEL